MLQVCFVLYPTWNLQYSGIPFENAVLHLITYFLFGMIYVTANTLDKKYGTSDYDGKFSAVELLLYVLLVLLLHLEHNLLVLIH
jgi:hypothetical protein